MTGLALKWRVVRRYCLLLLLVAVGAVAFRLLSLMLVRVFMKHYHQGGGGWDDSPGALAAAPLVLVSAANQTQSTSDAGCTHFDCTRAEQRCGGAHRRHVTVYVYPYRRYVDAGNASRQLASWSREFAAVVRAVRASSYNTDDPAAACLLLPSIDTLRNPLSDELTQRALQSLEWWDGNGANHVIFGAATPVQPTATAFGRAILVAAGLQAPHFRPGFDVSLPAPRRYVTELLPSAAAAGVDNQRRSYLLAWHEDGADADLTRIIRSLLAPSLYNSTSSEDAVLKLRPCSSINSVCDVFGAPVAYPRVLQTADFCLLVRPGLVAAPAAAQQLLRPGAWQLLDQLSAGCVPVVVHDDVQLPFSEVLDWPRAVVLLHESSLSQLLLVLKGISAQRLVRMRRHGVWLFNSYFSSYRQTALTTLQIINDRFLPHRARSHHQWNHPPHEMAPALPISMPYTAPAADGFTAVVLTYDRQMALFELVAQLGRVQSLAKIVVVWNNIDQPPPPAEQWPKIDRPLKLVRSHANLLSNRFLPYPDIHTECVFSVDDDITMLQPNEIEFAYQTWREFPDRIVGFPSRTHTWHNNTSTWHYSSDWTWHVSIVLTGAAFYHKYWHYEYSHGLSAGVRRWSDDLMNCEDLLMNFLVANATGKPPIKVLPRKKFKCDNSGGVVGGACDGGLSGAGRHYQQRSRCLRHLAAVFGRQMALRSAEFRAVPLLFREPTPDTLQRFAGVDYL